MKPELKLVEDTGSQLETEMSEFDLPPQQAEMPFAVVDGEPITQMPRDLYIPPDALQVFLEAFEGPLDLLLYLIRRQNLDILDIPIAEITRQYMSYIEVMSELQLELAGEYLLMAAMLAEINSRMLLPRPASAEGTEEDDPRAELVRRLQEYERFKKAAEDIDRLPRMERDTMPTSIELVERKVVRILPQVTLQEMLLALKDVMSRAEMFAHHHVHRDRLSVRQRMSDILSTLRASAFIDFTQLFRAEEGRMGVTVTFSAILELMKEGLIEIVQAEPYAPLHVRPASGSRHLTVVSDNDAIESSADAENEAALAQPAQPDENEIDDEEDDLLIEGDVDAAPAEEDSGSQDQSSDVEPSAEHSDSTEASVADVHEDSLEVSVEASGEASERLESAETDSVTEELQSHEHVEGSDEESKRE
jgi:segregation and condensation protein A